MGVDLCVFQRNAGGARHQDLTAAVVHVLGQRRHQRVGIDRGDVLEAEIAGRVGDRFALLVRAFPMDDVRSDGLAWAVARDGDRGPQQCAELAGAGRREEDDGREAG